MTLRVGVGYDSHRLAPPGPLVLGGVSIAAPYHLEGHSDGDAVAHAVSDAVLGAAGCGDIGEMFSNQDPENKGRDSIDMLRVATRRIQEAGWRVQQIDVVVIAEEVRVAPHRDAMRRALGGALDLAADAVGIKGKTNEGLGWIGRGEGIACIAVATLIPTEG